MLDRCLKSRLSATHFLSLRLEEAGRTLCLIQPKMRCDTECRDKTHQITRSWKVFDSFDGNEAVKVAEKKTRYCCRTRSKC